MKSFIENLRLIYREVFTHTPYGFIAYGVLSMCAAIAPYVSAFYFGKIGAAVIETKSSYDIVLYLALAWSVFMLVESICYTLRGILETWFDIHLYPKLQVKYLFNLNNIDIGKTESEEYITTFQKLTNGSYPPWQLISFTRKFIRFVAADFLVVCISLAIIAKIGILYVVMLIVLLLPRFVAELVYGRRAFDIWSNKSDSKDRTLFWRLHSHMDTRTVKPEMILHRYVQIFADQLSAAAKRMFGRKKNILIKKTFVEMLADILYQIGMCILVLVLVKQTLSGMYEFSFFTLVFYSLNQISGSVSTLLSNISAFINDGRTIQEVKKMYDMKPLIVTDRSVETEEILPQDVLMRFKDVSFAYAGSEKRQNQDLTFDLYRGERLAVIGLNGAGKSTLIKLMTRIYDPLEGQISVQYQNSTRSLTSIEPEVWQKHIACMFQDYGRYEFTIREYITLGLAVNEEKIKQSIDMATAGFVYEFPNGIDQQLGVDLDGVDLSKGQWQKLALARTMYRDSSLIILDEPTATVDALLSREIYENLKQIDSDKTLVFISHNMIDIPLVATRIMMIEDGKIVGMGTHKELLKTSKAYKELYQSARG